jgi:branched-chain amino acid transport system permease protein
MENYLIAMGVSAGIYALMALGLNVIWGMAGLVNLGLVGFFAVGAYVSALLTTTFGLPIWAGMLAGMLAGAATGVVVALITARLRGDYLAIVTLGFAETIRMVADNEVWLTHGSDGISGIPGPFRAELTPTQFNLVYLGIVAALVTVAFFLFERLSFSPFGRVLRAIRDDEQVAAVAGKWVIAYKVKAFAIGCGALGIAGALYAHYTSFIAPDIFVPLLTLYIKLSLLAGGVGSNRGAIAGAVLVVTFLEGTRFIIPFVPGVSAVQGAALREMLVSGFLLLLLRFRTQGLVPEAHSHLSPTAHRPLKEATHA